MQLLQSLICILILVSITPAIAEPIQWHKADGGNGHWYDAVHVAGGVSWSTGDRASDLRASRA